jgi:hypothetical protein
MFPIRTTSPTQVGQDCRMESSPHLVLSISRRDFGKTLASIASASAAYSCFF